MIWWGEIDLEENLAASWELGPLRLAVQRLPSEWRLSYEYNEISSDEEGIWSHQVLEAGEIPDYTEIERYMFRGTDSSLGILPALADRPVISRPMMPFTVPAREEATIFVSTPLWAHIQVADPPQALQYLPIRRPSDTWFGPSTLEGELCYASRTYARLNLSEIPIIPSRAITRVLISNRASSALLVERLSLPVPFLSLYATPDGRLWTEAVALTRSRDSAQADLQILKSASVDTDQISLVASPRNELTGNLSIRAFGAILREATGWS